MPAQPAKQIRHWHNPVAAWISRDATWLALCARHPAAGRILQAIANAGEVLPDGSIVGAFGGRSLVRAANVSHSTFWTHLRRLEAGGYVVTLALGGTVRLTNGRVRSAANTYGIPGHRGALDVLRAKREVRFIQPDQAGRPRRVVLHPGDQAMLWHRSMLEPSDRGCPLIGQGVSAHRTGGVRSSDTIIPYIIPSTIPCKKTMIMVSKDKIKRTQTTKPGRGKGLGNVEEDELRDLNRLLRLHGQAILAGLSDDSQAATLRWVAMADHALAVADKPAAMFAHNVRRGLWHHIRQVDEERAHTRLKAFWMAKG